MAPDDRKIKCTTRLGALNVPRSSAHKAKEFVGFRTLFSHLFVPAKIEIQEQFSMRLTSQTNLLMSCYVARYVSPKCVSVWLLTSKPCLFPLKSSLEFVLHRGKPKFISFPVKFPADRSKFQFYTTALYYGPRTVLPCLCLCGRNNDTYAFQYTFKNNTTQ